MTYISRGTRLIVSRWLDECDAEYKLRASRKRSEGRLKRHSSCDDLRAWSNSECVNYGYLLDLMSDGESTGKSHVHLYGRFIPVPLLLKIFQGFSEKTIEQEFGEDPTYDNESGYKPEKGKQNLSPGKKNRAPGLSSFPNNSDAGWNETKKNNEIQTESRESANENLWKSECEKYLLEKKFSECRLLLCIAVGKLEKIDEIICDGINECENVKNEEMEFAGRQNKSVCNCSTRESRSHSNTASKSSLKKMRDMGKSTELLRKISDLKQKLKIVKEKRDEVYGKIQMQRMEKCESGQQVTEIFSRQQEIKLKKLQKKLEKLVTRKGQLLLKLAETINTLNKLKKSIAKSKSRLSFESKGSLPDDEFHCGVPVTCTCGWQCTDNVESSNSFPSENTSQDNCSAMTGRTQLTFSLENVGKYSHGKHDTYSTTRRDIKNEESWQSRTNEISNQRRSYNNASAQDAPGPNNTTRQKPLSDSMTDKERGSFGKDQKDESKKLERKSKLKFICPQPSCRRKSSSENFDNIQNIYAVEEQQQSRGSPVSNVANPRPYTSPSTTRQSNLKSEIPERKIKSETTMEEIEKALRNYEQRLKNLDSLEYKIKNMKEKVTEGNRQREEWMRQKVESRKLRAAEREQSNKEITKLCSENWALKKKVRELMEKVESQCGKIECLKTTKKSETEELKQKLSEYHDSFEIQQNRICMLENYVINQRTEIQKLTNLVNKLNANASPVKCFQDKSVQRSRSYSPESIRTTKTFCRSNGQVGRFSQSSEEDEAWCCDEWRQQEPRSQQRISGPACCSPQSIRRRGRCVN